MQCSEIQEMLSFYLDDWLSAEEKTLVEQHLAVCSVCRKEMETLRCTIQTLASLEQLSPPLDFNEKVRNLLEKEVRKKSFWKRFVDIIPASRLATVACMVLAVVVTVQNIGKLKGPMDQVLNSVQQNQMVMETEGIVDNRENEENVQLFTQNAKLYLAEKQGDSPGAVKEKENLEANYETTHEFQKEEMVSDGAEQQADADLGIMADSSLRMLRTETTGTEERKIIRRAKMLMEVADFDQSEQQVIQIVEENSNNGWFIENGFLNRSRQEVSRGGFVLRVPESEFYQAVGLVEALGQVREKDITNEDVTESFVNLSTRIQDWEMEENLLLDVLNQTKDVDELQQLKNELNLIRQKKETAKGELNQLDNAVQYSTIQVDIMETEAVSDIIQNSERNNLYSYLFSCFFFPWGRLLCLLV